LADVRGRKDACVSEGIKAGRGERKKRKGFASAEPTIIADAPVIGGSPKERDITRYTAASTDGGGGGSRIIENGQEA